MKPGDPIVIEKTANGWLVRDELRQHSVLIWADLHCFQHLDYDQLGVQSGGHTLFGFLLEHFKKPEQP